MQFFGTEGFYDLCKERNLDPPKPLKDFMAKFRHKEVNWSS